MVTIEADEEVWRYLQVRKNPGDSNNDVLRRELGLDDDGTDEGRERNDTDDTPDSLPDAADAAIDQWVPEGDVATSTARDATRTAVAWLRDHEGPATRSTIVDAAKPGEVSEQQWWVRGAQPGLAMLAEEGVVERPTSKSYQIDG